MLSKRFVDVVFNKGDQKIVKSSRKKHKISPKHSLHLYKPNPPSTQAPGHVARGTLASRVKTYIAPYLERKSTRKKKWQRK